MRNIVLIALVAALGGCGTIPAVNSGLATLRSQPALELGPNLQVSTESAVVAGALVVSPAVSTFGHTVFSPVQGAILYLVYDPLAPNWSIEERVLSEDTFILSMRAKSFRTGGDGEPGQILKRRALQLQREKGYVGYRLLDYSEGVESSTPFTRRVSEGTIQLVKAPLSLGR